MVNPSFYMILGHQIGSSLASGDGYAASPRVASLARHRRAWSNPVAPEPPGAHETMGKRWEDHGKNHRKKAWEDHRKTTKPWEKP